LRLVPALVAGVATVFAFAPFGFSGLPIVTLALLFLLWQSPVSARAAAAMGFAFGIGLFGTGASWVYVALNVFGGMPALVAGIGTAGFCAFLALYPAAVGWVAVKWSAEGSWPRALAAATAWPLAEWARSVIFTGFPWLSVGYAALPGGAPNVLAGYGPIGGMFLISLVTSLAAAALALAVDALVIPARSRAAALVGAIVVLGVGGAALSRIEWTTPVGVPTAVSLLQGNILQERKFDPDFRATTFDIYADLIARSRGRLVVLPESAYPVFADEVPEGVLLQVLDVVVPRNGDALIGMFTVEPPLTPGGDVRYFNSVISFGTADPQLYRKRHLVPFGESIPLEPVVGWFIRKVLAIPLANQARGIADPAPLAVAGQRVAINICYEDAFGAEIRPQAAAATLLVNVTNDAWYGRSLAALQHNQIAAMRALELGRPMLRATNTGVTSAIAHDGRVLAQLPWFTQGILEIEVTGRRGETPYVKWGDAFVVALAGVVLLVAIAASRRRRPST